MTTGLAPDGDGVCLFGGIRGTKSKFTEVDRLGGEDTM